MKLQQKRQLWRFFLFDFFFADINSGYIYWIEYDSGNLKSAKINGSNVNILFDGNSSNAEHGLDTDDKYIYFSSINQLLRIQKFHENMGKEPYVLLNATENIYSVLMHKTKGKILTQLYTGNLNHNWSSLITQQKSKMWAVIDKFKSFKCT